MALKGTYALSFKTHTSFGVHHENLNEDKKLLIFIYAYHFYRTMCIALSLRESVCPSVTLRYRGHFGSKVLARSISLGSLLLGASISAIQSKGNTPKIRVEQGVAVFSRNSAISMKQSKIGSKLLLMTNMKLHTRFRLVPKSTTLDDHEGPLRTVFQNTCAFQSPPRKFE